MKIGILTFHRAHNYGAVLQAYALQEIVKKLGHSVKFIDYKTPQLMEVYKIWNFRRVISKNPLKFITKSIKELIIIPYRYNRSIGFYKFISTNLVIEKNIDFESLNKNFDVIIIGSDQVWNFNLTKGFDSYYWGNFKTVNSNLKLISYAASMERSNITKAEKDKITLFLKNFDSIGVRESSLKEILSKYTQKEITTVVDPTLLLNINKWNNIAKKPKFSKPYLLLYQVRNSSKNEIFAEKVAKTLGLDIKYLSARVDARNTNHHRGASPEEYLGLFKHAKFVLCSSFHGTVFSILFNIPFYYIIMNDDKDSRSLSLLKFLNLEDRAKPHDTSITNKPINWTLVKNKIDELNNTSLKYLRNSLS